jgi:hypothetical protein
LVVAPGTLWTSPGVFFSADMWVLVSSDREKTRENLMLA